MNRVASMPVAERRVVFAEAAERLQIKPVIVEKDFWVCWVLGLLFGHQEWSEALVFKGGTALSKVFGIIRRFSEDIDLSVSPVTLGISEAKVNEAGSRRQRDQWMENLEAACGKWVMERLQPDFEQSIRAVIGLRPGEQSWLEFQLDAATHSPVLLFYYSRHYADVAAMANRTETVRALADDALRERVVNWKARFFARSWARYDLAAPGTFRLVPPPVRVAELARDYQEMQDMFLDAPMSFDMILETLRRLEARINQSA